MKQYLVGYIYDSSESFKTNMKIGFVDVVDAEGPVSAINEAAVSVGDYFAVEVSKYPVRFSVNEETDETEFGVDVP